MLTELGGREVTYSPIHFNLKWIANYSILLFMRLFSFLVSFLLCILNTCTDQHKTVFTQRYDNRRSSWNDQETILTASNVTPKKFGLLFTRPVDDQIYAQP